MSDDSLIIKPKRVTGEDGYKTISIRIKEDVVSQIDDISAKTGRSRNELIGMLLQYAVARCKIEE